MTSLDAPFIRQCAAWSFHLDIWSGRRQIMLGWFVGELIR